MKRLIRETAKQVGILYHYTSINSLKKILNGNILKSRGDYISFTRNQNFDFIPRQIGNALECRIEIDGDKLSNDYKIKPYNDEEFTKNNPTKMEQEEMVKGYISPIIPYIVKIILYKDTDNFAQIIKEKWNIDVDIIEKEIKKQDDKYDFSSESNLYDQPLTESFIREHKNEVDWPKICRYQTLTEPFMEEFQNKLDWYIVSRYQILSESFIQKFIPKKYWSEISEHQILSEDFIREFQEYLDWNEISRCQILSEPFIQEFQDKIKIYYLKLNNNISPEIKKNFEKGYSYASIKRLIKLSESLFEIDYKNQIYEIYKNPSLNTINKIKRNDPHNSIRGVIYNDGTIYVWGGEILHRDMANIQNEIDIDGGCRFHFDPSWGFDFDFNRRFTEDEAKKYIKQFESYLNQIGNLQNNDLYLWGIEEKGKGPFKYTYDELFSKIPNEVYV